MKGKLVQIGNSRGVRLPKLLLEEAGLTDEVEIRAREGAIVIERIGRPRAGWADAARQLRQQDDDRLLDQPLPTRFDEKEWRGEAGKGCLAGGGVWCNFNRRGEAGAGRRGLCVCCCAASPRVLHPR